MRKARLAGATFWLAAAAALAGVAPVAFAADNDNGAKTELQAAMALDRVRDPLKAISALEQAIARASAHDATAPTDLVRARIALAMARAQSKDFSGSLADFDRLAADLSRQGSGVAALLAEAQGQQAVVLDGAGRTGEAAALLERVIAGETAAGRTNGRPIAAALSALGIVKAKKGDYAASVPLLAKSVALFRALPDATPVELGDAWRSYAVVLGLDGQFDEEIVQGRMALAYAGAHLPEDSETYTGALANVAGTLVYAGRFAEAEPILRRLVAIEERQTGDHNESMARALANLASTLMALDNPAGAETLLARAGVQLAKVEHPQRPDSPAIIAKERGIALYRLGRTDEAKASLRAGLTDLGARVGPTHPSYANSQAILARMLLDEGDLIGARILLDQAQATVKARLDPDHPIRLLVEQLWGEARLRQGDESGYETVLAAIKRDRTRVLTGALDPARSALAAKERNDAFARFAGLAIGKNRTEDAFAAIQLALLGDLDSSGTGWLARQRASSPEVAELLRGLQDDTRAQRGAQAAYSAALANKDDAALAAAQSKLDAIRHRGEERVAALTKVLPEYATLIRPDTLSLAQIQAALQPGEALLLSVPMATGTVSMLVDREHATGAVSPVGMRDVIRHVQRLRASVETALVGAGSEPAFDAAAGYALYRAMVPQAFEARLANVRTLHFQSGGALASVPMAALLTAPSESETIAGKVLRDAPWLLRRFALARPITLAALAAAPPASAGTRVAAIGAPALEGTAKGSSAQFAVARQLRGAGITGSAIGDLPALPEAEAELRSITQALDPRAALILTGARATEAQVEGAPLADFDIIVFATHGLVSGDVRGLAEPALVLTPQPPGAAAEQDDGLLTASEIARLRLNADWIILSACNTAAGEGGNAPVFSGLARAFVQAGARSLLLSQWPLEDRSASRITIDTVRKFANGSRKSAALRGAQLAMLKHGGAMAHPAFWAGFMLLGR